MGIGGALALGGHFTRGKQEGDAAELNAAGNRLAFQQQLDAMREAEMDRSRNDAVARSTQVYSPGAPGSVNGGVMGPPQVGMNPAIAAAPPAPMNIGGGRSAGVGGPPAGAPFPRAPDVGGGRSAGIGGVPGGAPYDIKVAGPPVTPMPTLANQMTKDMAINSTPTQARRRLMGAVDMPVGAVTPTPAATPAPMPSPQGVTPPGVTPTPIPAPQGVRTQPGMPAAMPTPVGAQPTPQAGMPGPQGFQATQTYGVDPAAQPEAMRYLDFQSQQLARQIEAVRPYAHTPQGQAQFHQLVQAHNQLQAQRGQMMFSAGLTAFQMTNDPTQVMQALGMQGIPVQMAKGVVNGQQMFQLVGGDGKPMSAALPAMTMAAWLRQTFDPSVAAKAQEHQQKMELAAVAPTITSTASVLNAQTNARAHMYIEAMKNGTLKPSGQMTMPQTGETIPLWQVNGQIVRLVPGRPPVGNVPGTADQIVPVDQSAMQGAAPPPTQGLSNYTVIPGYGQ